MSAHPYLLRRGFTAATIAELGWAVGSLGRQHRRYGLPAATATARVWRIPYREHGKVIFERIRLIDEADVKRFGGKYRQPSRTPLRVYDPDGRLERPDVSRVLMIEGEANAGAARQMLPALPVVGLPGKAGVDLSQGRGFAGVECVWLWLDREEQGNEQAETKIVQKLHDCGVTEVLLVTETDTDANDLLREHGNKHGGERINAALEKAVSVGAHRPRRMATEDRVATVETPPPLVPTPTDDSSSPYSQLPDASSSLPVYSGRKVPEDLLAYEQRPVGLSAERLGMSLGGDHACVLPHHRGSATIRRDPKTRLFMYFETGCRGASPDGRTLATVRAALNYGHIRKLSRLEAWCWYSRLFWEADPALVELADIQLPPLPDWAGKDAERLRDGAQLLLRIRWRDDRHHGQPVAIARAFAAGWAGLADAADPQHKRTYRALKLLRRLDILRRVGTNRRASTYLPGSGR